ncbi:hypothetical protein Syun_027580 [Stephania yunnanensis]|uniref:Replication protein A 70 kDa DNA-binding subunit B/D first OB fold domain-containing protein n=1 Tax=Stephania yunnanensis TaxID=152371 RepID=A0AAP0HMY1_9MAGN
MAFQPHLNPQSRRTLSNRILSRGSITPADPCSGAPSTPSPPSLSRVCTAASSSNPTHPLLETLIHAIIQKHQVRKYKPLLQEGGFYSIKFFRVILRSGLYYPVANDHRIHFMHTSIVRHLDDIVRIPKHKFEFVDEDVLQDRDSMAYKDLPIPEYTTKYITKYYNTPIIVIVTSTLVKMFKGQIGLSTTSASKVYINLDIPAVKEMIERYKIHLSMSDESGSTTFVLFNDVAEKLLDTTVNKLVNSGPDNTWAPTSERVKNVLKLESSEKVGAFDAIEEVLVTDVFGESSDLRCESRTPFIIVRDQGSVSDKATVGDKATTCGQFDHVSVTGVRLEKRVETGAEERTLGTLGRGN